MRSGSGPNLRSVDEEILVNGRSSGTLRVQVKTPPVKDAGDGASRDVLHEDGHHPPMERGPQKAHDVGVSKGLQELHLPLQMGVLSLCSVGVRGVQAHLLHGDQLAVAGQTTVHLVGRNQNQSLMDLGSSRDPRGLTIP